MCDYSLHAVSSRPAKVGDKLVSSSFEKTSTRGFAAVGEPNVAVCLLPGTEVAFATAPRYRGFLGLFARRAGANVARFREINSNDAHTHHDALEFSDGCIVSLQQLAVGQIATVLQLPNQAKPDITSRSAQPSVLSAV
jgi:hypothetical protein